MLFVALLLPFRGALAVTGMLCHQGLASTSSVAMPEVGGDHDGDMHQHALHGQGHDGGNNDGHAGKQSSSCGLCSSICGAPPLPADEIAFSGLLPPGAERFAPIAPPHAEFALGGLERPPRTI